CIYYSDIEFLRKAFSFFAVPDQYGSKIKDPRQSLRNADIKLRPPSRSDQSKSDFIQSSHLPVTAQKIHGKLPESDTIRHRKVANLPLPPLLLSCRHSLFL